MWNDFLCFLVDWQMRSISSRLIWTYCRGDQLSLSTKTGNRKDWKRMIGITYCSSTGALASESWHLSESCTRRHHSAWLPVSPSCHLCYCDEEAFPLSDKNKWDYYTTSDRTFRTANKLHYCLLYCVFFDTHLKFYWKWNYALAIACSSFLFPTETWENYQSSVLTLNNKENRCSYQIITISLIQFNL